MSQPNQASLPALPFARTIDGNVVDGGDQDVGISGPSSRARDISTTFQSGPGMSGTKSGWATPEQMATYLTTGYWRETGQLPHRFDPGSDKVITVSLGDLTAAGRDLARAALEAWELVADVRFRETDGPADITYDDARPGASAGVIYTTGGVMVRAHVNIGTEWLSEYGTTVGSYAFQTYIHETGHALGLGHAGNYFSTRGTEFRNDSWQMSVMSYNSQAENRDVDASFAHVTSPMMADIIAAQSLYGPARGGVTAGNTLYGAGSNLDTYLDAFFARRGGGLDQDAITIFDEGGVDTIDLRDDIRAQNVNLDGGRFSDVYGLVGNLGISGGTVIENYVAGSAGDRVSGNAADNRINGMAGNDVIRGLAGADILTGGAGRDRLVGGPGNDRMTGGAGRDVFVFSAGRDVIEGFEPGVDRLRLDDALWPGPSLDAADLRGFVRAVGADLRLDFGQGDQLTIRNMTWRDLLDGDPLLG